MGHVLHFQTHGFKTRQNYSSLQLDGLGDSWGELAVPYLLAKFVFTELKYPGWVGLKVSHVSGAALRQEIFYKIRRFSLRGARSADKALG